MGIGGNGLLERLAYLVTRIIAIERFGGCYYDIMYIECVCKKQNQNCNRSYTIHKKEIIYVWNSWLCR